MGLGDGMLRESVTDKTIKAGDLVFLREWPDEETGDWTLSNYPPLLVIEVIQSKQIPMFGGSPYAEQLVVMDSYGTVRAMPAGYFISEEHHDVMLREIQHARGR
jgi:hypothetical protein